MSFLLPKEHFKQRGQILGVDPGPFIFDPYQQYLIAELSQSDRHRPFTSGSDRNGNDALRRRIFERVVQQIDSDALQTPPIAGDRDLIRRDVQPHSDRLALGFRLEQIDRLLKKCANRKAGHDERQSRVTFLIHIQHVIDHAEEEIRGEL